MATTNRKEFFLTVYVLYCLISSPFYVSLCDLMFKGSNNNKNTVLNPVCINTKVIYLVKKSRHRASSIKSRRRIFTTFIYRFIETVAALGRTDDIQVNRVEMTLLLTANWLKKTLKCLFFSSVSKVSERRVHSVVEL